MFDAANLDEFSTLLLASTKGPSVFTWSILQDRQLLVAVRVHCDQVLGVGVKNQPPAGPAANTSTTGFF